MMKKIAAVLCFFMIFISGGVLAYRPLSTEDAGVAGKGVAQTELSWDYLKWDNSDMKDEKIFLAVPIYGLTDSIELSVEIPYLTHNLTAGGSEEGLGDLNLVAKYLLVPGGKDNPSLAIKGVVKLDNGDFDKGLGSGDKDYSIVAVTSDTTGSLTGHIHFGYTWIGKSRSNNLRDITIYGIALHYAMTDNYHLLAEYNGSRHSDTTINEDIVMALAGLTYNISDKITFGAAYRWGLSDSAPKWSTSTGLTITY